MLKIEREDMVHVTVEGTADEVAELVHWIEPRWPRVRLRVENPRSNRMEDLQLTATLLPVQADELWEHFGPDPAHVVLPPFSAALLGALNDRGGHALQPDVVPYAERLAPRRGTPLVAYLGGLLDEGLLTASEIGLPPEQALALTDKGRAWLAVEAARIAPGGVLQPVDDPVHGVGAGRQGPVLSAEAASVLDWLAHHPPTGRVHGWQATQIAKWRREVGSDHVDTGMDDLRRRGMLLPGPDGTYVTSGGTEWLQEWSRRIRARADGSTAKEDDPHMLVHRSERYPRGWSPDDDPAARMR